jgi:parallel beta-helix repeat protein
MVWYDEPDRSTPVDAAHLNQYSADLAASAAAADASATAAAASAALAVAPTDTAMAAVLANPASATSAVASSTYGRKDSTPTNVKDYGALGDGTTDDAAALNAALAAGYDVLLPGQAGDIYTINSTITIPAGKTLRASPGVTLKALSTMAAPMVVMNSDQATLRDIYLDGNRAAVLSTLTRAVAINNGVGTVTGVTVRNVRIRNAKSDSIIASGTVNDLTIVDNDIADGDYAGITIQGAGGSRIIVSRNRIRAIAAVNPGVGIQFYQTAGPAYFDVVVSDNEVSSIGATGVPIEIQFVQRATVSGNVISGTGMRGISMGGLVDSTVTGNSISDQTIYGIELGGLTRCVISGNTIKGCQSGMGGTTCVDLLIADNLIHTTDSTAYSGGIKIQTAGTKRVTIRGNQFVDVAGNGIRIVDGTPEDVIIDNNVFHVTSAATLAAISTCITIDAWLRGVVTGNICWINKVDLNNVNGVIDVGAVAVDLIIARNTIRSTSGTVLDKRGIVARGAATGMRVDANRVYGVATGIYAGSAVGAVFTGNRVEGCTTAQLMTAGNFLADSLPRLDATAAPTAGTWVVGTECKNLVPAVGSPKGWLCTVAGTPGTWVSTGNL